MRNNKVYRFRKFKKILNDEEQASFEDKEIQKIIKIYESLSGEQRSFLALHYACKFSVQTIVEIATSYDKSYVIKELHKAQNALKHTNRDKWEDAFILRTRLEEKFNAYYSIQNHRKIQKSQKRILRTNILEDINKIPDEQERQKKKLAFFILSWKDYIGIAIFALVCLAIPLGVTQSMFQLGIIQVANEKSTDVSVNSETKYDLELIETLYLPEYLPEGYILYEQIGKPLKNDIVSTTYKYNDNEIMLQQNISNIIIDLDNENVVSESVKIHENEGIIYKKNNLSILIWEYKNYYYLLESNQNIKKEELLKIAHSIKETSNEE